MQIIPIYLNQYGGSSCPQKLEINSGTLDSLSIGTELSQGDKPRLFIIRDTIDLMTLSMSHLLEHQDGYLYSSAYHYWNHYSRLSHKSTKPLVFVDIDSFGYDHLIPITISHIENNLYPIPVLNTREKISIDSAFNPIETYNYLCQSIASHILTKNFPAIANNIDTVHHLGNYLQKIAFFQRLQSVINQQSFSFLIEVAHNSHIFYKRVTLSRDAIAQLVYQAIDTQYLHNLAIRHPQYQFALISQYNIFPQIQQTLPQYLCLNPSIQDFQKIWRKKSQQNFPLFGIHLDQIEFAVAVSTETGGFSKQWIQLSTQENAISYEGNPIKLIGHIPNINQDFFRITKGNQTANLPIKLNGKDYCRDNVPQDYHIEIEASQNTEDICTRIEFNLQPGSVPQLKVSDLEGKYKITTCLINRRKISFNYIPLQKINSNRHQESLNQIERLRVVIEEQQLQSDFIQLFEALHNLDIQSNQPINYKKIKDLLQLVYEKINGINNNRDLLQHIEPSFSDVVVKDLNLVFQNYNLQKLVDVICQLLMYQRREGLTDQSFLVKAIILISKFYKFSQNFLAEPLYLTENLNIAIQIKYGNFDREYIQCLARLAVNNQLQSQYFDWFDSYYNLEKSQYLWGYGRILLWYYNFESTNHIIRYRENFLAIEKYLLTKSPNDFDFQDKQNAFLSLLYLLTFRANEPTFCQQGSEEIRMAERVIHHFQDDRIVLKQVSQTKPINQFFQEMIEGTSTEEDVNCLLHS